MLGVEQPTLEVAFEGVEGRAPIDAGGFHANQSDAVALEPVEQDQQTLVVVANVWVS